MKAWRVYGVNDIRLDEIPSLQVRPGCVVLQIQMVEISVTEVQMLQGNFFKDYKWATKLHEEGPLQMFGHEFCANVVEVGKGVAGLETGDRVFLGRMIPCYECELCAAGYEILCRKGPIVGRDIPGCLAEYALLPAKCLVKIPDSITDSEATAMQPLLGALGYVAAAEIQIGDNVAIFGQGVMGLACVQLSRFCGANKIISIALREESLSLSRRFGADITINASRIDPVQAIKEASNGIVDIAFDCAGGRPQFGLSGTKTLAQAIKVVKDTGKVIPVAIFESGAALECSPLTERGIQYRGARPLMPIEVAFGVDLVALKRVHLAPLVTHILEGIDKIPEAIDITANKRKYGAIYPAQVRLTQ